MVSKPASKTARVGRLTVSLACLAFSMSLLLFTAPVSTELTDEPRFEKPIRNITVISGRKATLKCVVENLGTYKVSWIHMARQTVLTSNRNLISTLPRFSVSYDNHKTWQLYISGVKQEDRGLYMCQVNTNPTISQVGFLQVVVPPNVMDEHSSASSVAVKEYRNISLTCRAEGFPAPKIVWRREDGQSLITDRGKKVNVIDGEYLNLTRISRTKMGAYLCIATNGVPPSVSKRIIVDVEFPPTIFIQNQLVSAPVGTSVTINCHIEAYPQPIRYWGYENVTLLPTTKYVIDFAENGGYRYYMKLTVNNLQPQDFGTYRCISKNSLGYTESHIRLYETPLPSIEPKEAEQNPDTSNEA